MSRLSRKQIILNVLTTVIFGAVLFIITLPAQAQISNPGSGTVTGPAVISALGYTPLGNSTTGVGADGQIIMKNGAASLWHTVTAGDVTGWLGYTPAQASGTNLQFGMFTAGATITGNSRLTENSGGTQLTYSGTGGVSTPSLSTSGSTNGEVLLTAQGSFGTAPASNQASWAAPGSYATSARYLMPAAPPANLVNSVWTAINASGTVVNSFSALTNFAQTNATNTFLQGNTFSASVSSALFNNQYSPIASPSTCGPFSYHHNGAVITPSGTSQDDCAFFAAATQADTDGKFYTVSGPPGWQATMNQCWLQPDSGGVNVIGFGAFTISHGYSITDSGCTATSTPSGAMIQFSNNSAPTGMRIENVHFNGGGPNVADQVMDIRGTNSLVMNNIWVSNFWGTQSAVALNQGTGPGTGGKNFQLTGSNWNFTGNYNGMHAAVCSTTSDGSGNLSNAVTCSDAGSGYLTTAFTTTKVLGPAGVSSSNPCATMGTASTTITSGAVSAVTLSGFSGCQPTTLYTVLPLRLSSAPYAVDANAVTDSHVTDLTVTGMGASGCIHVGYGSLYLTHYHPVYCTNEAVVDNEFHSTDMEHDSTIGGYGIVHTTNPTTPDVISGGNYTFANTLNFKYTSYVKYVLGSKTTPFNIENEVCDIGSAALPGTNTYYQEILYSDGTTPDTTTHSHLRYEGNTNCKTLAAGKNYRDDPTVGGPNPLPYTQINCWGDSLTAGGQDGGTNYCAVLGTLTGLTANNYGISGQTSTQIAVRTGAVATSIAAGVTIPTSGGVTVTFPAGFEPAFNANTTSANCVLGTIDTVQGCTSDNGSHVYTFTRSTSGSTVTVNPGDPWTPVLAASPTGNQASLTGLDVFWAGRNNVQSPATVLSDVAAMVAAVPAGSTYSVLSVPNFDVYQEWPGAQIYEQMDALNQYLASTYPSNFVDVRRVLVSKALQTNNQDQITFGHDIPASSQRANYTGGTLVTTIDNVTCVIQASAPALSILSGSTLMIDSEKIYVQTVSSSTTTATCLRGYAATTAASHTSGAAITIIDNGHLGGATGYTTVANQVFNWVASYPTQSSNWLATLREHNGALSLQRELNQPTNVRQAFIRATMNNLVSPSNLFQGQQALTWITSGANNVALGKSALFNLTTGGTNTAVGVNTLTTITTLSNMTAVGFGVFNVDTTGNNGVGVGANACAANTTGGSVTCIGASALTANTTGNFNVAVGQAAAFSNTTSSDITAIGRSALQNSTAADQTGVGYNTLFAITTGSQNTALGSQAGTTTGTTQNVANNQNTFLGYNTGANVTTQVTNSFSVGNSAQVAKSNQGVLGNSSVVELLENGTVRSAIATAPTASSGTLTGTNNGGMVAGLSAATTLTITFSNGGFTTWAACTANASASLATSPQVSTTTTAVTFTFPALTGTLYYHCDGN